MRQSKPADSRSWSLPTCRRRSYKRRHCLHHPQARCHLMTTTLRLVAGAGTQARRQEPTWKLSQATILSRRSASLPRRALSTKSRGLLPHVVHHIMRTMKNTVYALNWVGLAYCEQRFKGWFSRLPILYGPNYETIQSLYSCTLCTWVKHHFELLIAPTCPRALRPTRTPRRRRSRRRHRRRPRRTPPGSACSCG